MNLKKLISLTLSIIFVTSIFSPFINAAAKKNNTKNSGRYSAAKDDGKGANNGQSEYYLQSTQQALTKKSTTETSTLRTAAADSFALAAVTNSCNCVVFRLDDLQDYWINDVQVAVMNQFISKNQKLSVGPIVNLFGADSKVVNKTISGYNSGLFEIFIHGWNHNDHTQMTLAQQSSTMQQAQNKLQALFGAKSKIFIPPFNAFNANTLSAMSSNTLKIISAADYTDGYEYFKADGSSDIKDNFGIYHMPESIGFVEYDDDTEQDVRVSNSEILAQIDSHIATQGYAVVTLHHQSFANRSANGEWLNTVNQTQMNDLISLIDSVVSSGYPIKTFNELLNYNSQPTSTPTPNPTPTPVVVAPVVTLNANPTTINSGGTSTLTWSVTGTTPTCTKSNGWTGSAATSGSQSVTQTTTKTYTLTCTNSAGNNAKSVTVTVNAPTPTPTVTTTPTPTSTPVVTPTPTPTPGAKINTTTNLTSNANPSVYGQKVTFTATVVKASGIGTPSGTITFKNGSTTLGTATLSGGIGKFTTTVVLQPGSHNITAVYGGSASFNGSTSAVLTQTVNTSTYCGKALSAYTNKIIGTFGNDTLNGTSGDDLILGFDGADFITALGGNDCIYGGAGEDEIYGGNGNDTLNGEGGDDDMNGNAGNDKMYGGAGPWDYCDGAGGTDTQDNTCEIKVSIP